MLHVLFVGEGPTDVGLHQGWLPKEDEEDVSVRLEWSTGLRKHPETARCGAIPIFVLRIMREEKKCSRRNVELEAFPARPARLHRKGFARKVTAAMARAKDKGLDGVVFVVDRDGPGNKRRLAELKKGREDGQKAGLNVPTAVGVPVEMLEAWLLADESALAEVLGRTLPGSLPSPESMEDPKTILNELDVNAVFDDDAVRRAETIAECASLDTVSKRCPRGFTPFKEDVVGNLC